MILAEYQVKRLRDEQTPYRVRAIIEYFGLLAKASKKFFFNFKNLSSQGNRKLRYSFKTGPSYEVPNSN